MSAHNPRIFVPPPLPTAATPPVGLASKESFDTRKELREPR